jgi:hypothetical protein
MKSQHHNQDKLEAKLGIAITEMNGQQLHDMKQYIREAILLDEILKSYYKTLLKMEKELAPELEKMREEGEIDPPPERLKTEAYELFFYKTLKYINLHMNRIHNIYILNKNNNAS